MTISVDTLRQEINERRDLLARLHQAETQAQSLVEQLEQRLAEVKRQLEADQAAIGHEQRAVEALQAAVAVLTERMPEPVPIPIDPITQSRERKLEESRAQRQRELADAKAKARVKPDSSDAPRKSARDPLKVHPKRSKGRVTVGPIAEQRSIPQRAAELDMTQISPTWLERAELAAMILVDEGPMTNAQLAAALARYLECAVHTATSMASIVLTVLYRQDRIRAQSGDPEAIYRVVWEATPAERASNRLGADADNYAGTTTRWPTESQQPARGTHISVNSSAFEGGKR